MAAEYERKQRAKRRSQRPTAVDAIKTIYVIHEDEANADSEAWYFAETPPLRMLLTWKHTLPLPQKPLLPILTPTKDVADVASDLTVPSEEYAIEAAEATPNGAENATGAGGAAKSGNDNATEAAP